MAKSKKTTTAKPDAAPSDVALTLQAKDDAIAALAKANDTLTAENAALRAEKSQLVEMMQAPRHEQVAAYRNGRDCAVQALRAILNHVAEVGTLEREHDRDDSLISAGIAAIERAEVMP